MTLGVFNQNWSEKISLDQGFVKTPWLQKVISSEGTLGKKKYKGQIIGDGPLKFFKSKIYEHMEE